MIVRQTDIDLLVEEAEVKTGLELLLTLGLQVARYRQQPFVIRPATPLCDRLLKSPKPEPNWQVRQSAVIVWYTIGSLPVSPYDARAFP